MMASTPTFLAAIAVLVRRASFITCRVLSSHALRCIAVWMAASASSRCLDDSVYEQASPPRNTIVKSPQACVDNSTL
jgi:hypothetical protein